MKKRLFVLTGLIAFAFIGYLAFSAVHSTTSLATAAKKTYSADVYVAGHGGHFAKANVTIDPNNADDPLKVNSLDMVNIGTTVTHKTHDARIDSEDSNTLFWSTYAKDDKGKMHVGKSSLKDGSVIKDVAMDPDPRAPGTTGPLYCASGQSKKFFMPIFMGIEGYIDVFDKASLDHKHRVFLADLGKEYQVQKIKDAEGKDVVKSPYQFVHGVNSNDHKKFLITLVKRGDDNKMNGEQEFIVLDMAELEKGKLKVIAKATHKGEAGKTITFRQFFSKDDKLIFQAAGDRMWVIDAATLKLVDEKMTKPAYGENHDIMPTPDGKYAVLTLRTADTTGCDPEGKPTPDKKITDGTLVVYDADAKKIIGKTDSVCFDCHKKMGKGDKNAILCGLDANYKK